MNCRYIRGEIDQNAQNSRNLSLNRDKGREGIRLSTIFQRGEKSGRRCIRSSSLGKSEGGKKGEGRGRREEGKLGRGRNRARRTNLFVNFRNLNVRGVSIKRRALRHVHTCTRLLCTHTHLPLPSRDYFLPPFRLSSTPLTFFSAATDSRVGALNIKRHHDPASFFRTTSKPSPLIFRPRNSNFFLGSRLLLKTVGWMGEKKRKEKPRRERFAIFHSDLCPIHPSYLTIVGENGGSGRCTLPSRSYKGIVHAWMILRGRAVRRRLRRSGSVGGR